MRKEEYDWINSTEEGRMLKETFNRYFGDVMKIADDIAKKKDTYQPFEGLAEVTKNPTVATINKMIK